MARTKSTDLKASVIIPTYNGEEYLKDLLTNVFAQELSNDFEVIVIDSGSSDQTLSVVKEFSEVQLIQIPNSEFGHGRTRNMGAKIAKGEFVVYLSQDAVPASKKWLEFMLEPFYLNEKVACVYGKQIPRPFCDITTKREVSGVFNSLGPDHSIMINLKNSLFSGSQREIFLTFFSDVNSAVRRDFLINKIPYRNVKYSEDQLLGKDVLEEGYFKAYSPLGSVMHSNEYSLGEYFYRKHDEYMGVFDTLGVIPANSLPLRFKRFAGDTLRDFVATLKDKDYSFKRKFLNLFTAPARNLMKEYAAHLVSSGKHRASVGQSKSLEAKIKKRNST